MSGNSRLTPRPGTALPVPWYAHRLPEIRCLAGGHAAYLPQGAPPSAPLNPTSITADASATVSFLPPASAGSFPVTSYTVTPYVSGVAGTPVTTAAGSVATITGSDGSTYCQAPVTGLVNSTAYTFSVHASSSAGAGAESVQTGANTPLSGLVFGDDFNGPTIDPEWWVYTRAGYQAQSEIEYYLPSQVTLDGSSNLVLTGLKQSFSGPNYPSAGGGTFNATWKSGAVQSNTRSYAPASGNTMTFEARQQVCPGEGGGMWPGLFWLEGDGFLTAWKTDPNQTVWDNTSHAEIDVAEFNPDTIGSPPTGYLANVNDGNGWDSVHVTEGSTDLSAAMHVYTVKWKPGASLNWFFDGGQARTGSVSPNIPASGAHFFLLIYLQIIAGTATSPQACSIDYVRVYDQNLG